MKRKKKKPRARHDQSFKLLTFKVLSFKFQSFNLTKLKT